MEVFPYSIIRIAGMDFSQLEKIRFSSAIELLKLTSTAFSELERVKENLVNDLYSLIRIEAELSNRKQLLLIRRQISQCKVIEVTLNFLSAYPRLKDKLNEYDLVKESYDQSIRLFGNAYRLERTSLQAALLSLANSKIIRNGLILSSESLNRSIDKSNLSATNERNTIRRFEFGLIRYISRTCAKPTPNSSFTNLALVKVSEQIQFLKSSILERKSPRSHVRLNVALLWYLDHSILNIWELKKYLFARLNPTIQHEGEKFRFAVNFSNLESFQSIDATPTLSYVFERLSKLQHGIQLSILVEYLSSASKSNFIDSAAFVSSLLSVGFLELIMPASPLNPDWNKQLCDFFESRISSIDMVPSEILRCLHYVEACRHNYEISGLLDDRRLLIDQSYDSFHKLMNQLDNALKSDPTNKKSFLSPYSNIEDTANHENIEEEKHNNEPVLQTSKVTFDLRKQNFFYEDTSLDIDLSLSSSKLVGLFTILKDFCVRLGLFEWTHLERRRVYDFFCTNSKKVKISALDFFESYQRSLSHRQNTFISSTDEEEKAKNDFVALTLQNLKDNYDSETDQYSLWLKDIPVSNMNKGILQHSFAAFIQLDYATDEDFRIMLNSIVPGHGKLFSRFLHLFDVEVLNSLRRANNTSSNSILFVENCDASYFNANIHPPLLDYEIWIPGSNSLLSTEKQIPITDLEIRPNHNLKELELWSSKKNVQVMILDLGFQGPMGRSALFNFLRLFDSQSYPSMSDFFSRIDNILKGQILENSIVALPRIVFEKQWVLRRKTWVIRKDSLTLPTAGEEESSYFLRVNQWRTKHKLPQECFVRMGSMPINQGVRMDDYKPQYIDFHNPFLVDLFRDYTIRSQKSLIVEEMLPSSKSLLDINGAQKTAEFLIQVY